MQGSVLRRSLITTGCIDNLYRGNAKVHLQPAHLLLQRPVWRLLDAYSILCGGFPAVRDVVQNNRLQCHLRLNPLKALCESALIAS